MDRKRKFITETSLGNTIPHEVVANTDHISPSAEDIEGSGGTLQSEAGAAGIREEL